MVQGVDSASNRNEYQEYFLGGRSGRCVRLTTLPRSCWTILVIFERLGRGHISVSSFSLPVTSGQAVDSGLDIGVFWGRNWGYPESSSLVAVCCDFHFDLNFDLNSFPGGQLLRGSWFEAENRAGPAEEHLVAARQAGKNVCLDFWWYWKLFLWLLLVPHACLAQLYLNVERDSSLLDRATDSHLNLCRYVMFSFLCYFCMFHSCWYETWGALFVYIRRVNVTLMCSIQAVYCIYWTQGYQGMFVTEFCLWCIGLWIVVWGIIPC